MNESPTVSPLPPASRSQDFAFLRAEGLGVIQSLAATSWTDHNLHDPGITLLEAICYAITETGLRTGMEIGDLLASSTATGRGELFTAAQVLPVAPVTPADMRSILIDHPLVNNAWLFPLLPVPRGRFSALLEFADETLNSNIFLAEADPPALAGPFSIALAFPHWDEDEVRPFRNDVGLLSATFSGPPGGEWNNIEGSTSFFARATVTYQPPVGGPEALDLWIVVQILTDMADPATDTPLVLQEVTTLIGNLGGDGVLKDFNRRVMRAHDTMRVVRRYASPYRNLCEDIVRFNAVRMQEIAVSAIIEVGSGVALEELLAEIYLRIDEMIAPAVRFAGLDEQLTKLGSAEAVFDGPLTDSGFLSDDLAAGGQLTHTVYTSDVIRLIYQLRSADEGDVLQREDVNARRIISVRSLSLSNYIDNRPITTRARDCLRLVKSQRHAPRLSVAKSRVVFYRNGLEVGYDSGRVQEIFAQKKAAAALASVAVAGDLAVPLGEAYPIGEYYPIQNDLPLAYGVGEAGLPEHAPVSRRAQARQLKGYLFLFEQMLAGYHAQLAGFNAFFSADPGLQQTIFQQPLYHAPDIAPLFKAFDARTMSWPAFRDDPTNPYALVLRESIEAREQFLERRNAVLDHLLATQGEDMHDRAALLFRLATRVPGSAGLPLPELLEIRRDRRLSALGDLIEDKSAYYYDLPALHRDRAQAHGNPFWRADHLADITQTASGYEWRILGTSGTPLFRQALPASSPVAARRTADQVAALATDPGRYAVRIEAGGERRLELRPHPASDPLAESVETYATDPEAADAIQAAVEAAIGIWTAFALIPLEWRLFHLLGIDARSRRRLTEPLADFAEIFDDVPDPNNEKRFRIWEAGGFAGDVLLESTGNFPGPTDADAAASAMDAVEGLLDPGMRAPNYAVEDAGGGSFRVVLRMPDGTPIARGPTTFPAIELAEAEATRIRTHLYRLFSGEGCFLVEHHLLFPRTDTDVALEIGETPDPYSFQLTIVLPSGQARDFTQADSAPEPGRPALNRDGEFRRYAEEQIRKYCPAQILPRVLWVDRALPGTAVAAGDPSLDAFEQTYFAWLRDYLAEGIDEADLDASRNALTAMMNALYEEYHSA